MIKTFKTPYFILSLILSSILLSSCTAPLSKEAYLGEFQEFVADIEQSRYKDDNAFWMKNLELYRKFVGPCYDKFADDFTWREELEIGQLKLRFGVMHSSYMATRLAKDARKDYALLQDELQFYVENDMQNDIDFILDNARRSGEVIYAEISNLLNKIENDSAR